MRPGHTWAVLVLVGVVAWSCGITPQCGLAEPQNLMDPSLTELGYVPLPDLGLGIYTRDGHIELGGLYPDGWPVRPPDLDQVARDVAANLIQPLDAQGHPDPEWGTLLLEPQSGEDLLQPGYVHGLSDGDGQRRQRRDTGGPGHGQGDGTGAGHDRRSATHGIHSISRATLGRFS